MKRYCEDNIGKIEKIGGNNPYERCVHTKKDCLVYNSR